MPRGFFIKKFISMAAPNHNPTGVDEYWIIDMLLIRLPFLENTPNNVIMASRLTLEIMHELDVCYKIDADLVDGDTTLIGNEDNYSLPQRTVISDLVAYHILFRLLLQNMAGGLDSSGQLVPAPDGSKILTEVVAGSVEAKWEQFDIKKGGFMATTAEKLLTMFKKNAINRAYNLGCVIDICDDCSLKVACIMPDPSLFIVVPDSDSDSTYTPRSERG